MRPIWSGTISFVLVNIPVKLYSGVQSQTLNFDLLHKKDLGPIRYARICKLENQEVPYQDLVRGYEYEKDSYVIITDEDFKNVDLAKTYSIDIISFVKLEEIDPIYFEKPYYLGPDKGSAKSFALLRDVLEKTGKVAVAKFILREREHLVMVRAKEEALVLNQLRFLSQIREAEKFDLPAKTEGAQMEMAISLVEHLTKKFEPEEYRDDYLDKLNDLIAKKIKGQKVEVKKYTPQVTHVDELMEKLKQSLEESEKLAKTK